MFKVEYKVVFSNLRFRQHWIWKLLKPGFQHVECWREMAPGAWVRFDTALEFLSVEVYGDPPETLLNDITVLHYIGEIPEGSIRQPFFIGPETCVTLSAALLGVRLPFFVRTPWQLYNFLRKRNGTQIAQAAA